MRRFFNSGIGKIALGSCRARLGKQPMLLIDAPRPAPRQFMFQCLSMAKARERLVEFHGPDGQRATPANGLAESTKRGPRMRKDHIPSFSTTSSRERPPRRFVAARSRCLIASDLSKYAVSRSEAISRHNSIGTITAVGSPAWLETIWMSASDTTSVYL
jgi:hypothetical protein